MSTTIDSMRVLARAFAGAAGLMLAGAVWAQSPPLGPPLITVDKTDLSAGVLTGMVNLQVKQVVDENNASLAAHGKDARVSAGPVQFNSPYIIATQHTNQPNEWMVTLPVMINIHVHVPHWFDRDVFVPLNLNVTCNGWQTGVGNLKVDPQFGPPSFEGGSWVEDAPGLALIKDAVNAQVRSSFNLPAAMSQLLSPCVSLGVAQGTGPNDKFAAILFDLPPTTGGGPARGHLGDVTGALKPHITVAYISLKRLVAHALPGGTVLYQPTENIVLDTYADFTQRVSSALTLKENDVVTLNMPPAVIQPPLFDKLVVIANVNQEGASSIQDSAFDVFPQTANYGPGRHTLQITKTYSQPPGPGHTKPLIVHVPAYELTYDVSYQGVPVIRVQ